MNSASDHEEIDEGLKILKAHAVAMSEHFDSVQIIATKLMPDGSTRMRPYGEGNWYARYGSVRDWLKREEYRSMREVDE